MPQQTEVLVQQGAIKPSTNNLLSSIDEAIEHFEDSETQRILKKYGFDLSSLIDDLNDSKDCVSQFTKAQQGSKNALETYIKIKTNLGWIPENMEEQVNEYLRMIGHSLETGSHDLLSDWAITNAVKVQENRELLVSRLATERDNCIIQAQQQAWDEEEIQALEEYFNVTIRPLQNTIGY